MGQVEYKRIYHSIIISIRDGRKDDRKALHKRSSAYLTTMDFVDYSLLSPASLVAVVTAIFLLNQAWPHLSSQKTNQKQNQNQIDDHEPPTADNTSDLSVSKEPSVPEGWWNGREAFELERRAIFSKVKATTQITYDLPTNRIKPRHGYTSPTGPNSPNQAPTNPSL